MTVERIGADWATHAGHVARYEYAARHVGEREIVKDVACGIGYGAALVTAARYIGYDRPEVIAHVAFPGHWYGCDLDAREWWPVESDVTLCFETLEHVAEPDRLAHALAESTRRCLMVSVPVVPTVGANPYHRHDFTGLEIPSLFIGFRVAHVWDQPAEQACVWRLVR